MLTNKITVSHHVHYPLIGLELGVCLEILKIEWEAFLKFFQIIFNWGAGTLREPVFNFETKNRF